MSDNQAATAGGQAKLTEDWVVIHDNPVSDVPDQKQLDSSELQRRQSLLTPGVRLTINTVYTGEVVGSVDPDEVAAISDDELLTRTYYAVDVTETPAADVDTIYLKMGYRTIESYTHSEIPRMVTVKHLAIDTTTLPEPVDKSLLSEWKATSPGRGVFLETVSRSGPAQGDTVVDTSITVPVVDWDLDHGLATVTEDSCSLTQLSGDDTFLPVTADDSEEMPAVDEVYEHNSATPTTATDYIPTPVEKVVPGEWLATAEGLIPKNAPYRSLTIPLPWDETEGASAKIATAVSRDTDSGSNASTSLFPTVATNDIELETHVNNPPALSDEPTALTGVGPSSARGFFGADSGDKAAFRDVQSDSKNTIRKRLEEDDAVTITETEPPEELLEAKRQVSPDDIPERVVDYNDAEIGTLEELLQTPNATTAISRNYRLKAIRQLRQVLTESDAWTPTNAIRYGSFIGDSTLWNVEDRRIGLPLGFVGNTENAEKASFVIADVPDDIATWDTQWVFSTIPPAELSQSLNADSSRTRIVEKTVSKIADRYQPDPRQVTYTEQTADGQWIGLFDNEPPSSDSLVSKLSDFNSTKELIGEYGPVGGALGVDDARFVAAATGVDLTEPGEHVTIPANGAVTISLPQCEAYLTIDSHLDTN